MLRPRLSIAYVPVRVCLVLRQHGIGDDNKGSKMLKAMGWNKGEGLGVNSQGIVKPIQAEMRLQVRR